MTVVESCLFGARGDCWSDPDDLVDCWSDVTERAWVLEWVVLVERATRSRRR